MKAAIYARYSSESQRASSIEDQMRLCRQEAERRGWTVTATWKDEAASGALGADQRPGFRDLMAAASRREFDVLIVDDSSRLSRDSADATRALQLLDFLGIKFVARSDGIDTVANGKSSRLLYGIKSAMNEEFLRDLGEKTWRGLEGRVREGYSPGGLPYGYRSEPQTDERGRTIGYRRLIHEPDAETVRRIFRLYVGEEGGHPHSAREIVLVLNRDKIAPPGARWKGRVTRQCSTWTYTAIIGHRRLGKGILNNPLYVGRLVWNRSQWLRHPVTKRYTYRLRPQDDWVSRDLPELRIVPQDLWDRAQAQMSARHALSALPVSPRFRRYLLSGFIKCGVCGSNYIIRTPYSYKCGASHDRGPEACTNHLPASRARLERTVLEALRSKLYTEDNIRIVTDRVRGALLAKARQHDGTALAKEHERELQQVEREIANITKAIRQGIITPTTKAMLVDAEGRREALREAALDVRSQDGVSVRVQRILERLPEIVKEHLSDLDMLLAAQQVDKGKAILGAFDTRVTLHPAGNHLDVEIMGRIEGLYALAVSAGKGSNGAQHGLPQPFGRNAPHETAQHRTA